MRTVQGWHAACRTSSFLVVWYECQGVWHATSDSVIRSSPKSRQVEGITEVVGTGMVEELVEAEEPGEPSIRNCNRITRTV